jgi:hypothetical protein
MTPSRLKSGALQGNQFKSARNHAGSNDHESKEGSFSRHTVGGLR